MSDWALGEIDVERWLLAGLIALGWLVASAHWLRPRYRAVPQGAEILIAHASQTGTAQALADIARQKLAAGGRQVGLLPLNAVPPEALGKAKTLMLFAATTGAGEAPDPARQFEQQVMRAAAALGHLEVFILALGDRSYDEFCAFGQRLGRWASESGARVSLVEVDNQSADDLARWDALMRARGLPQIGSSRADASREWIILSREKVADGDPKPIEVSRSGGLYHCRLAPADGEMPEFAIGDLFEWHSDDGQRRDFSIASMPGADTLELFIRQVELPGGAMGKASAVFTQADGPSRVRGHIRPFTNFHETSGRGALLAIAAGSGWGGIRSHVLNAIGQGRSVWLIYGERGPDSAGEVFREMHEWHKQRGIKRLDLILSRAETGALRHVQESVAEVGGDIAKFLDHDGAVAICGAVGMGKSVELALAEILGTEWIAKAQGSGRWRSAIY